MSSFLPDSTVFHLLPPNGETARQNSPSFCRGPRVDAGDGAALPGFVDNFLLLS